MSYFKSIFGFALLTSAIAVSAGAQADRPDPALRSVIVRTSDLDLGNPADAARLARRLHLAAERVCEPLDARDLPRAVRHADCIRDALERAQGQVAPLRLAAERKAVDTRSR